MSACVLLAVGSPGACNHGQSSKHLEAHSLIEFLSEAFAHAMGRKMLYLGPELGATLIIKKVKGCRYVPGLCGVVILARRQLFHMRQHGLKEV